MFLRGLWAQKKFYLVVIFGFTLNFSALFSTAVLAEETRFETLSPHSNLSDEDNIINNSAQQKIILDPRITSRNLEVSTHQGIVAIKGTMTSIEEASAAIEDASSIPGVTDVDTSSIVLSKGMDPNFLDIAISAKIRGFFIRANVLERKPFINLHVETRDGVVLLSGRLDTLAQVKDAVNLANSVPNVVKVISRIQVNLPY